ncbi:Stabilin-2, partial [Mesitornis unicolor]
QTKKQCDQKLLIQMKTVCVPCSSNLETKCPAGYAKITNGTGIPDCRYH